LQTTGHLESMALVGGDVWPGRSNYGGLHSTCSWQVWVRCSARIPGFSAIAPPFAVHRLVPSLIERMNESRSMIHRL
jgi:hypothetical protein